MQRVEAGTAVCAICNQAIHPDADVVVTPDFLADDSDPFYRYSDASFHRGCFATWERRRAFVAHFNRIARFLRAEDGTYLQMNAEGELVQRRGDPPAGGPRPPV